jgi:hypothetical protein
LIAGFFCVFFYVQTGSIYRIGLWAKCCGLERNIQAVLWLGEEALQAVVALRGDRLFGPAVFLWINNFYGYL